jgi:hypothetical protein
MEIEEALDILKQAGYLGVRRTTAVNDLIWASLWIWYDPDPPSDHYFPAPPGGWYLYEGSTSIFKENSTWDYRVPIGQTSVSLKIDSDLAIAVQAAVDFRRMTGAERSLVDSMLVTLLRYEDKGVTVSITSDHSFKMSFNSVHREIFLSERGWHVETSDNQPRTFEDAIHQVTGVALK